jgi:hypothetical protein
MDCDGQVGTIREVSEHRPDVEAAEAAASESDALEEQLARLRQLVEQDAVEEARALAKELLSRWPASESVRHWASVLAPPLVSVSPVRQARPLQRERAWLKEHAGEYPGCWLAVFEDRLIAADPDLRTVLATARQTLGAERALLHFEPQHAETRSAEPDVPR